MDTIDASDGIHILNVEEWGKSDANLVIYTNASLIGLAFFTPNIYLEFFSSIPFHCHLTTIFFFEALAIALAIHWASSLEPPIHCLLIFTDLLNCVDMFNTLHAQDGYNDILLFIVCILISLKLSLCVFHLPGADNIVANAPS